MINDLDRDAREFHRKNGCVFTKTADERCHACREFDKMAGWNPSPPDRRFLKSLRIDPA